MRLLLDTHAWLWLIGDADRLRDDARELMTDPATELFLSVVSVWEIGIKHAAGKLRYSGQPAVQLPLHIARSGVVPLGITVEHALAAAALKMHHRDPFDRMIIAQALAEELTVVTADARFGAYDVPVLQAAA